MSTTTQILFNSPALHSLKRDQLLKLCKIHSIKASGKNVDLIERLKQHASSLPSDAPLNIAVRSEDSFEYDLQDDLPLRAMPRPSELWEVVMDDIDEVPESSSSQNTLNSLRSVGNGTGEFGTAASKSSGVSSSIRALASSLGINRAISNTAQDASESDSADLLTGSKPAARDSLATHAIPYDALPESSIPDMDHFVFNNETGEYDAPIPGNPLIPGAPAPSNARMSLTNPVTSTTIRLVTTPFQSTDTFPTPPRLMPFKTSFDLVMGSPHSVAPKWPASPFKNFGPDRIYPSLHMDTEPATQELECIEMPGGLSTSPSESMKTLPHSSSEPIVDIFSPTPQTLPPSSPSAQADNATRPLPVPRPEPFLFGSPLPQHRLSNHDFGQAAASVLDEMNKRLGLTADKRIGMGIFANREKPAVEVSQKDVSMGDKFGFDKAHEETFKKMDSIASHYAAKRGGLTRKRPPPDENDALVSGTRKRKSDALGMPENRHLPAAKKASVSEIRDNANSISKKTIPGGLGGDEEEDDRRLSKRPRVAGDEEQSPVRNKPDEEVIRKTREIEAVRRKAEARRRSSRVHQGINTGLARQSIGTRGRASIANTKNKLNKGSSSRFGFLSSAKNLVKNVWKGVGPTTAPSTAPSTASHISGSNNLAKANPTSKTATSKGKESVTTTSHPSLASKTSAKSTAAASSSSRGGISRFGFGWGNNSVASSPAASRTGSSIGTSSLGQKQRGSTNKSGSGTQSSITSNAGRSLKRTSSTLMAPTASSLAKMQSARPSSANNKHGTRTSLHAKGPSNNSIVKEDAKPVLDTITNNNSQSMPARIFNEALTTTTFSSPSKVPVHSPAKPVPAAESIISASKSRPLAPRRPRISRSRVIAKLGAQRVAANTASAANRSSVGSGKIRSSMGNGIRKSYGGVKTRTSGSDVLLSAKKKVRASEYVRRRSRAAQPKEAMDVKMTD